MTAGNTFRTRMDAPTDDQLATAAAQARAAAYAPYSDYAVGAALLTTSGDVVIGCNVENASYGLTICAERTAIGAAVAGGHRAFTAIAISTIDGGTPCGACRQVLAEFADELKIILADSHGKVLHTTSLAELLPNRFNSQ